MNEDFYISLIYKQLDGEISKAEQQQLNFWVNSDPENQALADDLEMVYSASEDYLSEEIEAVDVEAAFEKQMKLIKNETPKTAKIVSINRDKQPTQSFRIYRFASIAVAAAVLILAGYWVSDIITAPKLLSKMATENGEVVALSDGSIVTLQKGAELEYLNKFNNNDRVVKLIKGKATFKITKGLGDFQVVAQRGLVTVLGTVFDLEANDSLVILKVTEGKVNIKDRVEGYAKEPMEMDVIAGESVVLSARDIQKTKFDETGQLNYFEFKNTPMTNVIQDLENHFSIKLKVSDSIIKCKLTVTFDNQKLENTLQIIDKLIGTKSQLQADGSYIIKGGNCE